jgi:Bacterial capsule synthesis protein PGA_cap
MTRHNKNIKQRHRTRTKYRVILFIIGLCLLGLYYFIVHGFIGQSKTSNKNISVTSNKTPAVIYSKLVGNYLFSGTVMLGRAVGTYSNGNYDQPFSGMNTLGKYDAHIAVLECPITNNADSYENQVNNLIFNCNPAWVPYLKKYFTVLSLSSDHLNDQGPQGYKDTVSNLTNAGIQTVGNYNPHADKDDCKIMVLPIHLIKTNSVQVAGSLPVAMCSYNYKIIFSPNPGELESIKKWSKIMPVIGLMNGGPEYEHIAGVDQTNVAHKMIDYGADFVVGNGTHWVQNTEDYKGKLIVYSMGNFIFDQLDQDGRDALNLSVSMTAPYNSNLAKWVDIGNNCVSQLNSCLSLIESNHLTKISPKYSFNAIGSYGGYLQVATLANTTQQNYILMRSNWNQTMSQLNQQ